MNKDKRLIELESRQQKDSKIIKENERAYEEGRQSRYTSEQVEQAQKQEAKIAINKIYDENIFPCTNAILYFIYYLGTLIALPIVYFKDERIPVLMFWLLLFVLVCVSRQIEKQFRNNITKKYSLIIIGLIRFSNRTSIFCCMLTSFGYFAKILPIFEFMLIYLVMVLVFIVSLYFDVIEPVVKKIRSHCKLDD